MDALLEQINGLIEKIKGKLDELLGIVNDFLGWIPWGLGWLADKIKDAWDWLVEKFNAFWNDVTFIFGNPGDRGALETTGNSWSTDVGGPVSARKDSVDASAILKADDKWQGDAAGAYAGKAKLHQTALEKIVMNYTATATSALETVRGGLVKYYMGLITALGVLIAGIIGALASSATIFGIPAGIFIAAGAALIAIGAFYTGGTLLKSDCTTANTSLTQKMNDNNGFPNESWPEGAVL